MAEFGIVVPAAGSDVVTWMSDEQIQAMRLELQDKYSVRIATCAMLAIMTCEDEPDDVWLHAQAGAGHHETLTEYLEGDELRPDYFSPPEFFFEAMNRAKEKLISQGMQING